jgi:hypothetical protein
MNFNTFPKPSETISNPDAATNIIKFVAEEMPRQNPRDFSDMFPLAEIEIDERAVETLKGRFHNDLLQLSQDEQLRIFNGHRISKALESIIAYHVPTANWFGDGTEFVRPSEFDDVVHGIDGIVEFQTQGVAERLVLGIDASRNARREVIEKKIENNVRALLSEAGASRREVKYFASNITDERGPLRSIVPVVIGADDKACDELVQLFAEQIKIKQQKQRTVAEQKQLGVITDSLSKHPAQLAFLEQMGMQLGVYDQILSREKANERRDNLRQRIGSLLLIIQEIRRQRIKAVGSRASSETSESGVTLAIREALGRYAR